MAAEQVVGAFGPSDLGLLVRGPQHEPLAQLERGLQIDSLDGPNAMSARELGLARATDTVEPAVANQQIAGDLEDIIGLRARPQDDSDKLLV